MTRKHFLDLAHMLNQSKPDTIGTARNQWRKDAEAVVYACKFHNPKFNGDEFIRACEGWKR